ncbi:hypothetical protein [Mycobacterium riyadhense]|uniref:Ig-like domain-containing protein n=1 Tax=Mycobacterium riyadhense TaxID=486698 RepID=A0A1X2BHA3_9MYCO|nr:hypothetical protein [Mycobacterium riyadhense]MCV7146047.1 hypothetical protein [Mycobacterium riyadhense]ORW63050.1 hypothetical protein AWC22_03630 [Mycobacterium riyadhense]VTO99972.1 hypothetical protein BIN_B_03244 [Mycobacterium riyadhense]
MHVAALFVAGSATLAGSAINATQIPTTSYDVDQIPMWLTVPVVLVVHAPSGGDYDPQIFVVCKDPGGERRGALRSSWDWPDEDGKPSKYRCFTYDLSFAIESEGEYTIGAYYDAEATDQVATPIPLAIRLAGPRLPGNNGLGTGSI